MEEYKNLEEIIKLSKEKIDNNDNNVSAVLDLEDLKELRNLIARYEEVKEENIHWRGQYHLLSRKIDVIPKSKVKEKIEELRKKTANVVCDEINEIIIKVLQELLED